MFPSSRVINPVVAVAEKNTSDATGVERKVRAEFALTGKFANAGNAAPQGETVPPVNVIPFLGLTTPSLRVMS